MELPAISVCLLLPRASYLVWQLSPGGTQAAILWMESFRNAGGREHLTLVGLLAAPQPGQSIPRLLVLRDKSGSTFVYATVSLKVVLT